MTTTINASPTNGLVQTADGSGVMKLQSNGVTTNALAWCSYNLVGQTIRSSYNVSSVTYVGTGVFLVNFTNAMSDANYVALISNDLLCGNDFASVAPTTTSARFQSFNTSGTATNRAWCNVAIFGN